MGGVSGTRRSLAFWEQLVEQEEPWAAGEQGVEQENPWAAGLQSIGRVHCCSTPGAGEEQHTVTSPAPGCSAPPGGTETIQWSAGEQRLAAPGPEGRDESTSALLGRIILRMKPFGSAQIQKCGLDPP